MFFHVTVWFWKSLQNVSEDIRNEKKKKESATIYMVTEDCRDQWQSFKKAF